ncbi:hypothetical protein GS3922_06700 [Geobacillus subterraneus]|uniref:Uncharacterized protein n=2 Tax=Geobacillus TaxID=129337 RepID=A0ABM6AAT3_9BACL|nr:MULTISPECIES: hypothetical protein [Geobacillus]AMX83394.1 hypothetical protein GS3922_06700 [Geobacillus subterraneus]KZS24239.1 hypothetical protein A5418_02230 [Geobacillus subterraneus]OXB90418.1 hypothetical protein B9L21_06645 [Geobacillus uzenensis]QIZ67986.1 hypothetical protein HF500_12625 [Geobacillus subterraneus]WPZ16988.1 hypothetical protein UM396_10175 [Geobacillus subterraneus]
MTKINGRLITGTYDEQGTAFTIQRFKTFPVESVLRQSELEQLEAYLRRHETEQEGQVVILYDQMPVWLSADEVGQCLADLEAIRSQWPHQQTET